MEYELYIAIASAIVIFIAYIAYENTQKRINDENKDIANRISDDFGAISTLKKAKEYIRARDEDGRFVADDPSTPNINEAWVGGKSPAKKSKSKKAGGSKPNNTKSNLNKK